eukprot:CAMPEP_0171327244 /NCGR_PEP_ID=MMETSP0816-20121228/117963_1 /TAXON_ID=420281 /ORGANISM="Proboscia inermis, Strain CCAP1064/1" /LENGTH=60 /DNA_ID=CAMNT_0011826921 /DNA_START=678 /DNA_END=860 /DNA_ORIENTATION=+
MASALPRGAFSDFPAHATTALRLARIAARESDILVESWPMPSTPVMGTTARVAAVSSMSG